MSNSTTQPPDLSVARTIARQIGPFAFRCMGTTTHVGGLNNLTFDVKGAKRINKIRITLEPMNAYTVQFLFVGKGGLEVKYVATDSEVYVDKLHETIEMRTGLFLRLTSPPIKEITD